MRSKIRWALVYAPIVIPAVLIVVSVVQLVPVYASTPLTMWESHTYSQSYQVYKGEPVYRQPDLRYMTQLYTPLMYYVCGSLMKVFGPSEWVLKILTYSLWLYTLAAMVWFVRHKTRNVLVAAVSGLCLLAIQPFLNMLMFSPATDALDAALAMTALIVIDRFFPSTFRRSLITAGLLTVTVMAKQTSLSIAALVCLWAFLRDKKAGLRLAGLFAGTLAIWVAFEQWRSSGWFLFYTFQVPRLHPLRPFGDWFSSMFRRGYPNTVSPSLCAMVIYPVLLIGVAAAKLVLEGKGSRILRSPVPYFIAATFVSGMARMIKEGGVRGSLNEWLVFLFLGVGLGLNELFKTGTLQRRWLQVALCALLLTLQMTSFFRLCRWRPVHWGTWKSNYEVCERALSGISGPLLTTHAPSLSMKLRGTESVNGESLYAVVFLCRTRKRPASFEADLMRQLDALKPAAITFYQGYFDKMRRAARRGGFLDKVFAEYSVCDRAGDAVILLRKDRKSR